MSWKGFKDWLLGTPPESPLKDWEPGRIIQFPSVQPSPAEWPAGRLEGTDVVATAGQYNNIVGTSETVSDESEDSGNVTTETALEHAEHLPSSTFRVFPSRADGRNGYDTTGSARAAVLARQRRPYNYGSPGGASRPIKVYQAETVWRDVTEEYVKP